MTNDLALFVELFVFIWMGFALSFIGFADTVDDEVSGALKDATGELRLTIEPSATQPLRALRPVGGIETGSDDEERTLAAWKQAIETSVWAIFGEVDAEFFDTKV